MDVPAHKCGYCKRSFDPVKVDHKYCSARCRQAAYRRRKRRLTPKPYREEQRLVVGVCEQCQGSFWAKRRHARFCSISCRSLAHRQMKQSLPSVLSLVYGIPENKAADVIETQSIKELRRIVEAAGYTYSPALRTWQKAS